MKRTAGLLGTLAFALGLAACSTLTPATLGPRGPIADLAAGQRALWASQAIRSYTFTIERQCFCPEDYRGPFDVTVIQGVATLVTFHGGVAVADRVQDLPKTMEAAFDLVLANVAVEPDVVYDDRFGFPLRIALDPIKNAIDDESTYVISNFRVTGG
jgi:uncharacterized protein DUF6174